MKELIKSYSTREILIFVVLKTAISEILAQNNKTGEILPDTILSLNFGIHGKSALDIIRIIEKRFGTKVSGEVMRFMEYVKLHNLVKYLYNIKFHHLIKPSKLSEKERKEMIYYLRKKKEN
ncbi:acyl carrier protein [Candidatus Pacearchaeota archaeon]|nr:acyl carrier protein [Candidatus Pacearchaeota archaeon]